MKILVASNCPLKTHQGSGHVIYSYAKGIQSRGHKVKTYDPDELIFLPRLRQAKRLRLFIGYTLRATREAWNPRESYDIIELWGSVGWLACLILTKIRLGNYKVISRSNGLEPHYRKMVREMSNTSSLRSVFSSINTVTDGIGYHTADLLTVVSSYDEDFALKNSYQRKKRILKLENPLPDDFLQQPEKQLGSQLTIGFVGSWIERKGSDKLTTIINSLTQLGSKCNWIIAGVGKEGKREIMEKTNVSEDQIYEGVARENLKLLYRDMTVFLCLSSYESFGMVCSEAMACRCILVSTNVGFANGLVEKLEYIPIERERPDAVARQLYQIESNIDNYKTIGANGYKRVQQLKWSQAIDMLESHYLKFLSQ